MGDHLHPISYSMLLHIFLPTLDRFIPAGLVYDSYIRTFDVVGTLDTPLCHHIGHVDGDTLHHGADSDTNQKH